MAGNLKDNPLVSVVMSFHNGQGTLPGALRSMLWQTYENWELILLNDGSTDGSELSVRSFNDPRIRFCGSSVCLGLPARLNEGIALARGLYIARMDADDIAFPERFARQVEFLQNHLEVDLLATSALMIDEKDHAIGILAVASAHEMICRRPWHGFPMPHPTWMGRADWFRKHPYNETAHKAQDQALLYSAHRTSCFAVLPDVLLGYRYSKLSVRKTLSGRYHYLHQILASGNVKHLLAGMSGHSIAALRDLIYIALEMDMRVIKNRTRPINNQLLVQWRELTERLANLSQNTERE
jgi:glycosyltransferase involved in cell wall biosynthesis